MTDFVGRIDSVFTRQFSASIAAAAALGATTLTVVDGDDLDPAGQLQTPWDDAVYGYTFDGATTVTLATPLASAAAEGETLVVWDPATSAPVLDTVAHVAVLGTDNADDIVEARVAYSLIPLLPEGIRADGDGEAVTVRTDGADYVVAEVLGQAAVIDGTMIDPATAPPAATDGLAPASNPAVTVRPGIGSLFVIWEPIENADPVTYDVYAVPAADVARLAYPPLSTDRVGEADGTGAGFRALPDGTELTPAGSYAVAVYARDKDGQCTTSATPVIASPAQVTSEDLALNALTTDHLTANDALFLALQAEDIVGVTITGSTIVGTEFRTANAGNYWRIGGTGAVASIEAIPSLSTGPVVASPKIDNVTQESPTIQVTGTQMASGAISSIPYQAYFGALTQRSRPTASDPWGVSTSSASVAANNGVTLDAKAAEGKIRLVAEHIELANYIYDGNHSIAMYAGALNLSGSQSVVITSPSITIGGQTISDTGWTNCTYRTQGDGTGTHATHATTGPLQARLKNGIVYLRGGVDGAGWPDNDETVANLPSSAYWPSARVIFLAVSQNPGTALGRWFVDPDGTIRLIGTAASAYWSTSDSYPL